MLLGIYSSPVKKVPSDILAIPNFWHQDYYKYICHGNYFLIHDWDKEGCFTGWHQRISLKTALDGIPDFLADDLSNRKNDFKIIAFNEIFKSDAGPFSTSLRQNLTPQKIQHILKTIKECSPNEISITEHRLGSLFVVRQKWFLDIVRSCVQYLDAIGLQLWIQPNSPTYNFQKEVCFYLIKRIQDLGLHVFISECAIFEKDQQKQADILDELLQRLIDLKVTRFSYWYIKDGAGLKQPGRDCSLGPGLFDKGWNPKPAWRIFKKYANPI